MLRLDSQDIATDRLRLFRFVERAIEFRLRDGLVDPRCRNAFDLIFHGSFPPRPDLAGTENPASQTRFPCGNSTERPMGSQLRRDLPRASTQLRWVVCYTIIGC